MKATSGRFILVAVLICSFAVAMTLLLNYFKFRATTEQLLESRVQLLGEDIRRNIVRSLDLGLSFTELPTLQQFIEDESRSLPELEAILVFDPQGKVLYNTATRMLAREQPYLKSVFPPQKIPQPWLDAARNAQQWRLGNGEHRLLGLSVHNNFDLELGQIALRYSTESVHKKSAKIALELLSEAAWALTATLVWLLPCIGWLCRRFNRRLGSTPTELPAFKRIREVEEQLQDIEKTLEHSR